MNKYNLFENEQYLLSKEYFNKREILFNKIYKKCKKSKSNNLKHNIILPFTYSLEKYVKLIYDQGPLSSCTANAFCASWNIMNNIIKKYNNFEPSRLFIYYNERSLENTIDLDIGACMIDGEISTYYQGICSENSWPYNIKKFNIKPHKECYYEALDYKIKSYDFIEKDKDLIYNIKKNIYYNKPVLFACTLYESFWENLNNKNIFITFYENISKIFYKNIFIILYESFLKYFNIGIISIPDKLKEKKNGYHQMLIIGYDDINKLFIVQNSWGKTFGNNGFCYIPYDYIIDDDLAFSFSFFTI